MRVWMLSLICNIWLVLIQVAKEREELNDIWNKLEIKWLELQASRQRYDIRAREALLLERMREGLVYYLNEERTKENFSRILQWLDEHVTELLYTTRKDFKHELTVSSHVIALVDISISFTLLPSFLLEFCFRCWLEHNNPCRSCSLHTDKIKNWLTFLFVLNGF